MLMRLERERTRTVVAAIIGEGDRGNRGNCWEEGVRQQQLDNDNTREERRRHTTQKSSTENEEEDVADDRRDDY